MHEPVPRPRSLRAAHGVARDGMESGDATNAPWPMSAKSRVHGQPLKEPTVPRTKVAVALAVADQAPSSMPALDGALPWTDRRAQAQATRAAQARKASGRRRL